jgi:tetratricopeptide (TPR) repeat protein
MTKGLLLSLLCLWISSFISAQQGVQLYEKQVPLPTYKVAPPEKNPIFFRNEAYQGASRHYYPLKLNDQYINERIVQEWKHVILDNEYIEVAITPEIGGKLYYAKDKTNDYNFVYKNSVVKPSNIGMTGAWVSGGIEWCVLHHHRASTYLPLDYTTTENKDGSKTVWVGESEPRHGMRWTIGVTAFPGKSYFRAEGRIYNASPFTHSILNWANVAAHTNENYQTIFPPSAQVATFHSKTVFSHWPISTEVYRGSDFTKGVDISYWKNTRESNSFFVHELQEDFMGGYDHGKQSGTVHIGDHNIVRGAKLWQWGSGARGQATEARLTETDGPYVEIMVGAYSDNQPDYSWIKPYEVKKWEQYWYPVKGIGGFKNANLNGAVNLEVKPDNSVFLGYYSTGKVEKAKVVLENNGIVVFTKDIAISPDKPFTETIKLDGAFDLFNLKTQLIDVAGNEILLDYRPVKLPPVEKLPEAWQGYVSPDKIATVEELYLTGKRVEQFYAPQYNAMDWYNEALKRDPGDMRTNIAVGNRYLKNGDFLTARKYLATAIKRLTKDYTRPTDCEALYLQGLVLKYMGLYDEATDTLYRATWDYAYHSSAYFQLAQISMIKNDYAKALQQTDESLVTNARNKRAIALKASILRKLGDFSQASSLIDQIKDFDPLDFRLQNENYLVAKESGKEVQATSLLSKLETEMRGFDENYLELAVGYLNDGLLQEAEEVLLRFKGENPEFDYYLGFIYSKYKKEDVALSHFKNAEKYTVESIFPYRLETVQVLNTALKLNPKDGNAHYYTGNILYEKQPEFAIENWKKSVELNPNLAVALRNIGWGYYRHYRNIPEAITYYEKAIAINKNEAIYYTELDMLYELNNAPVEKRLKLFEGQNEVVKNRDDATIRQISVLTLAGQPEKAVEYTDAVQYSYREGASMVREVKIDAQLALGIQYFALKNYQKALEYFIKAQVPEEEAGSDQLGSRDIQVNYYIGIAYKALNEKAKADEFFIKSAGKKTSKIDVMNYYQGLSYMELNDSKNAEKVFESMIEEANQQLENKDAAEAGVIFGERETENVRLSRNYTILGLGQKGLKKIKPANTNLQKAVELNYSNLWAKVELENK